MFSKKRVINMLTAGAILGAVAFGITSYNTKNVNADSLYSQNIVSEVPSQDKEKLKKNMGIELQDLSDDDVKGKSIITKEQAIESANTEAGSWVTQAKKISVLKSKMTYKNFTLFSEETLNANPDLKAKGYIDNLPVWIVSYQGLNLPPKGGSLTIQAKPNTEYNVVVDAVSGKPLVAYRYR